MRALLAAEGVPADELHDLGMEDDSDEGTNGRTHD
jgi:hypothetical protein